MEIHKDTQTERVRERRWKEREERIERQEGGNKGERWKEKKMEIHKDTQTEREQREFDKQLETRDGSTLVLFRLIGFIDDWLVHVSTKESIKILCDQSISIIFTHCCSRTYLSDIVT